jgi:hypothetical protein
MIAISTQPPTPPAAICPMIEPMSSPPDARRVSAHHSTQNLTTNTAANDAGDAVPDRAKVQLLQSGRRRVS